MAMNSCPELELTESILEEIPRSAIYSTPASIPLVPDHSDKDITFFVACYNEEDNIINSIEVILETMVKFDWSWEIIVIDDASADKSVLLVKQYMCQHPDCPIILVVREENQGLAQNYVEAAFLGRGKYYKLVNGDNVDSSSQLASILCHVGEADMLLPYHAHTLNRTLFRRVTSRVFTFLVNMISGYRIRYYNGCGVHLRYNVKRWNVNCHGFDFQADLITRLLSQGRTYLEIPTMAGERPFGHSKAITTKNVISAAHFFLNLAMRRIWWGSFRKNDGYSK